MTIVTVRREEFAVVPPPNVPSGSVVRRADGFELFWEPVRHDSLLYYEVRRGPDTWVGAPVVGRTLVPSLLLPDATDFDEVYQVRARHRNGLYSQQSLQLAAVTGFHAEYPNSVGFISDGDPWDGTHTDTEAADDFTLVLAAGRLTGSYETPEIDALTNALRFWSVRWSGWEEELDDVTEDLYEIGSGESKWRELEGREATVYQPGAEHDYLVSGVEQVDDPDFRIGGHVGTPGAHTRCVAEMAFDEGAGYGAWVPLRNEPRTARKMKLRFRLDRESERYQVHVRTQVAIVAWNPAPAVVSLVDGDIPASIARDAEVTAAVAAHDADAGAHPGGIAPAAHAATHFPGGSDDLGLGSAAFEFAGATGINSMAATTTADGRAAIGAAAAADLTTHAALATAHGISAFGATLVDDVAAVNARTTLGLAPVAASGSAADLSTGTLPAARMPALTGPVTTVAGAVATTVTPGGITSAMLRDSAAFSVVGRASSSSGVVADIVGAADQVLAKSGVSGLAFQKVATAMVNTNAITNALAAQMAANTIKLNNTGSTANSIDGTRAQLLKMLADQSGYYYRQDFDGEAADWQRFLGGSGVTTRGIGPDAFGVTADHQGVYYQYAGFVGETPAGDEFAVFCKAPIILLTGGFEKDWYFCLQGLVAGGTVSYPAYRIGLMDVTGYAAPGYGLWLDTDSAATGVFRRCSANGGAPTATNTAVTAAKNTWYHARVVINAGFTSAEFFLGASGAVPTSIGTLTTTLPVGGVVGLNAQARCVLVPATTLGDYVGFRHDMAQLYNWTGIAR